MRGPEDRFASEAGAELAVGPEPDDEPGESGGPGRESGGPGGESGGSGGPGGESGESGGAADAGLGLELAYDPAVPAPLNVDRTPTGNADVDAQLDRLADADHLATDGHVEVYEDVHRGLRDALTALDARPGPPAPPSTYGTRS
ncbi:hypothetical protein ACFVXA_36185 [Streptomyces sp. NPDC058246]|uniref:hypothetical protein n=1 Tax=unclassified Streptomyces TaxID=2593676 RepID=UPI0036E4180A